ncbi:MAG: hypothetical protein KGY44_00795 [Halanaerobiales bacterium]|nr:hypothetical protein [Halanaerobiales bacterium]
MKKYIYTFLIIIIIVALLLLINNLGIISFREWGKAIISSTSFGREYVNKAEKYNEVTAKNEELIRERDLLKEKLENCQVRIVKLEEKAKEIQNANEALNLQLDDTAQEESVKQQNFEKLIKIYENLQPESAANILNSLNKEFAIKILRGLNDKKAAAILEIMEVEKAVEFSRAMQE